MLELPLAYSIMKQAAQAIGVAGEIGLIHRDVKPENILLTRKGRVKVADFGLCRDQDGQGLHLTQSGVTMGTPLYMSPEQAQGHICDHRSDLYSLGVTFYHMLAGVPPFRAETALALALKQVREVPRSMLVYRGDLPPELDALVLKLMAKSPADRYQSAGEMLADLTKLREVFQIELAPTFADTGLAAGDDVAPSPRLFRSNRFRGFLRGYGRQDRALPGGQLRPLGVGESLTSFGGGDRGDHVGRRRPGCTGRVEESKSGCHGRYERRFGESSGPVGRSELELRHAMATAAEQLHYALLEVPRQDRVAAFLAVPGFFGHSHDQVSKAYTQLARIWFRDCNVEALEALESELSVWKAAKTHEHELVDVVRIAIKLRKTDFEGVLEGFKNLTRDEVSDMYDPGLVELSLEICTDALAAARSGTESIVRETLQEFQLNLVRQLYRIEVPKANRLLSRAAPKRN